MPGVWEQGPNKERVDLVVAVPIVNKSLVSIDWTFSLLEVLKPPYTKLIKQTGAPVDVARNYLVYAARELGAKHIFFLDDDVIGPDNLSLRSQMLYRLLAHHVPIVSGVYWSKKGHTALWSGIVDDRGEVPGYLAAEGWDRGGGNIFEIDVVPMGCCLIDMRVFDVIPPPWFEWTAKTPDVLGGFSEDFDFCRKALKHGFGIFVDTSIKCRHETLHGIDVHGEFKVDDTPKKGALVARAV